ncbi:hypothetical protein WA026_015521 [Henosepilachna vigintioctopunctata]|uniref:AN1-type domain-containing protein n=1 Tax=Henosepilachna vigintioctopunctata TaxID=420089 RepID=A0AAW1VGV7_9CUCU
MELPDLGKHCSEVTCKRLDFLPIKCDACSKIFCGEHFQFRNHNCKKSHERDNQVPVCPLCNKPIPLKHGESADDVVGSHIDNYCQSDPARNRRKVYTNRCSFKHCKAKEMVPIVCNDCKKNFCLKHRLQVDHQCSRDISENIKQSGPVVLNPAQRQNKESASNVDRNIQVIQGNVVSTRLYGIFKYFLRYQNFNSGLSFFVNLFPHFNVINKNM